MTLKVSNVGELELLRNMLGGIPAQPLILRLYTNDYTPLGNETTGDFAEQIGRGYTEVTMAPGDWTFARVGNVSEATHLPVTWTFTGGVQFNIYGYYIVGAVDGILRWAEKFAPAFSAEIAGDRLKITPKITFNSY